MRVAFLAYRGSMRSGGLGGYLHPLTRELAARGVEVDVYVGPPYPDPMPWVRRTVRVHDDHFWDRRFTSSWRAPIPAGGPLRALAPLTLWELLVTRFGFFPEPFAFSVRAAQRVIRGLRAGVHYDLVHDVQTLGYGALWLRALGLPVVATVHHPLTIDLRSSLQRDQGFMDRKGSLTFHPVRTQGRVARRLDAILTSSEASVRELERGFGVSRGRIHNVANGVSLPRPGRVRPQPARRELLFIGRSMDPNKGLEHLLACLRELPEDVGLRVLDAAPVGTHVMRLVERLELGSRVRFDGKLPRAELERALAETTLVVIPSLFEGFGLPAVEALAAGTPIVATDAGALGEVVRRAGTGVLVPPGEPKALAQGIQRVLEDWPRQQRAAVAARGHLEAAFAWSAVAERTLAVYDRVTSPR